MLLVIERGLADKRRSGRAVLYPAPSGASAS